MERKKFAKMIVQKGPHQLNVEEFPIPQVKEDGMLIKIEATSMCGSDAHQVKAQPADPSPI